jgi:phosphoribosyl-ATP pyrophosphohydrolase/phosphoribosyl-AMP cyclohydrolase
MMRFDSEKLKFDEQGLIPAVLQDEATGTVLMVAYMNRESLLRTVETGETHFWSRSRGALWHKGETSGNTQTVTDIAADCDADALLVRVQQKGNACHAGSVSCFANGEAHGHDGRGKEAQGFAEIINHIQTVIHRRKKEMPKGSYTTYLFQSGVDKILKKVGEEATEIVIAAKNHAEGEIAWEISDLLYHLLVLLEQEGVGLDAVTKELRRRVTDMQGSTG